MARKTHYGLWYKDNLLDLDLYRATSCKTRVPFHTFEHVIIVLNDTER